MKSPLVWVLWGLVSCSASPQGAAPNVASDGAVATDGAEPDASSPSPDSGDSSAHTPPNPLLSENVPAFASTGNPSAANDDNPATAWAAPAGPSWIAYDLSSAPADERQDVLVAWSAVHAPCYIDTNPSGAGSRPVDYVIESNQAPSAKTPPTTGWTTLTTVTSNRYCARQHLLHLGGANWIRLGISKSTSDGVGIDFAVHGAKHGASDAWLFMGDSITYMSLTYAFSDLPTRVRALAPPHTPAVIDAAIGGTNTQTASLVLEDTIRDFPGRFVVLAYGTNDHAQTFAMSTLVEKVLAAGKVPVVPHMPWSSGSPEGAAINALIDAIYAKYPAVVRGPDLWAVFQNHTEWIPPGDVHPNAAGQAQLRRAWAATMVTLY